MQAEQPYTKVMQQPISREHGTLSPAKYFLQKDSGPRDGMAWGIIIPKFPFKLFGGQETREGSLRGDGNGYRTQ